MKIFEEKLLRLKQEVKLSEDQEVAALLGLSKAAFADRKKRDAFPEEKLWVLAQKRTDLNIDVPAVLTGISSAGHVKLALHRQASEIPAGDIKNLDSAKKSLARREGAIKSAMQKNTGLDTTYVLVPQHNVAASAGGGSIISDESVVDHLAFKREWITQSLGCQPDKICVIQVRGDSMTPTINDADLLLLDLRLVSQKSEGVYVIQNEGSLLVKRLRFKLDGAVEIISDNARYGTETLTGKRAEQLAVLGRVVWHGKKF